MTRERMSRRAVLRRVGVAAGVGLGGVAPFSGAVRAGAASGGDSYSATDRRVESFDGTELATTFYVPEGTGPFPAVLVTHGWANDRESDAVPELADLYASNGYAVLAYDSRGFGESGGLVGVDGADEVGDARALVSWLADRPVVATDDPGDPVVGMDGFSYAGGIQLRTAAVDDRLDAIVPRWAWHDLRFSNDPNGVLKWPWFYALNVSGLFGSLGLVPNPGLDAGGDGVPDIEPAFLELGEEALGAGAAPEALREFWADVSPGPQGELADVEAPALVVHGWHDRLFTPNEAFDNYRGLRDGPGEAKLLLYDGGHDLLGAPGESDPAQQGFIARAALRFFRRHLKGEAVPEVDRLAPVTLYREGTNRFESYDALPDGEVTYGLRSAAGPGTTRLRTGPDGATTAAFDFTVESPLEVAGAGEFVARVTPVGGEPVLSAALARDTGDGTEVLKDQVAVTPVEGAGARTVRLDLLGVEASLDAGDTLRLLVGVDDDALAPGLTDDLLYSFLGSPAQLQASPVGEYVPADAPSTDGLYFDSPTDPPTGLVVHHARPGESRIRLPTVDTDGGSDAGDGATSRARVRRSTPRF